MEGTALSLAKLRFAVCDDRLRDCERMARMINAYCEARDIKAEIDTFSDGSALIAAMRNTSYTVVFLDIFMNEMSGIEAARIMRTFTDCALVFVTSSADYALEGFAVNAIHYLVKPCTAQDVEQAMERCMAVVQAQSKIITVKVGRETLHLRQKDICYIEVFGNRSVIHTITGELETYTPLNALYDKLDKSLFLVPHRSFLVNVAYILEIPSANIVLKSGQTVPVSRKERASVRQQYLDYLIQLARGNGAV